MRENAVGELGVHSWIPLRCIQTTIRHFQGLVRAASPPRTTALMGKGKLHSDACFAFKFAPLPLGLRIE